jgi:FtsZ-binding cell division protein ZapB
VKFEHIEEKAAKQGDDHVDTSNIYKSEIEALKKSINALQGNLSDEQRKHAKEMS